MRRVVPAPATRILRAMKGRLWPDNRYQLLLREVRRTRPCTRVVEVGTWNGARAEQLAMAALSSNAHVTYHGFDLFEMQTEEDFAEELSKRPPSEATVRERLERFAAMLAGGPWRPWSRHGRGVRPWMPRSFSYELHKGYTRDTMPAFADEHERSVDFVFIDGGHSIETIENDWTCAARLVRVGGTIVLDDHYQNDALTDRFGCNFLRERLRLDPAWDVDVLPVVDVVPEMGGIQLLRATYRGG